MALFLSKDQQTPPIIFPFYQSQGRRENLMNRVRTYNLTTSSRTVSLILKIPVYSYRIL